MNRNELAKELNVFPWDVDDWLLWGCPAKKFRGEWIFDLQKMKIWLVARAIKKKRIRLQRSPGRPVFDQRWFAGRCPICIDRGFSGEKAGRVYTLGEVLEGEWHLRRTGIPCGHSAYVNFLGLSWKSMQEERDTRRNWETPSLGSLHLWDIPTNIGLIRKKNRKSAKA